MSSRSVTQQQVKSLMQRCVCILWQNVLLDCNRFDCQHFKMKRGLKRSSFFSVYYTILLIKPGKKIGTIGDSHLKRQIDEATMKCFCKDMRS